MNTRSDNLLEKLSAAQRSWLVDLANNARLVDMVQALKERGIETSAASLSRFLRRCREERLVEEGAESKEALETLAERGKSGVLREGTMEVVRQRLYERALLSPTGEEARELFGALAGESTRLKELELEARKVAALEEQVRVQRLKVELERAKVRVKGQVIDAAGDGGEKATEAAVCDAGKQAQLPAAAAAAASGESERERRLLGVIAEAAAILNRGGSVDERLFEARALLAGVGG